MRPAPPTQIGRAVWCPPACRARQRASPAHRRSAELGTIRGRTSAAHAPLRRRGPPPTRVRSAARTPPPKSWQRARGRRRSHWGRRCGGQRPRCAPSPRARRTCSSTPLARPHAPSQATACHPAPTTQHDDQPAAASDHPTPHRHPTPTAPTPQPYQHHPPDHTPPSRGGHHPPAAPSREPPRSHRLSPRYPWGFSRPLPTWKDHHR